MKFKQKYIENEKKKQELAEKKAMEEEMYIQQHNKSNKKLNVSKFNDNYGSNLSRFFNKKEEKLNKIKEN